MHDSITFVGDFGVNPITNGKVYICSDSFMSVFVYFMETMNGIRIWKDQCFSLKKIIISQVGIWRGEIWNVECYKSLLGSFEKFMDSPYH